jgi:APA family basic amino acid/polyamine antiporter
MTGALFSSDAWNNVTFIAGEIEHPQRNIPLSLLTGTLLVSVLYVLANVAYLAVLPFWGTPDGGSVWQRGIQYAAYDRVGVAATTVYLGNAAGVVMAVLIAISTFACNNGIILAGARVYRTMAADGLFFKRLQMNNSKGVPAAALWAQGAWSSVLCLTGRYNDLLNYVMIVVLLFYVVTIGGVFVLRYRKADAVRPYRAWGYPALPLLYMVVTAAVAVAIAYANPRYALPGLGIVAAGVPVYYIWRRV